jgi:glycosyltransferase involved in cell wall biosynthesis
MTTAYEAPPVLPLKSAVWLVHGRETYGASTMVLNLTHGLRARGCSIQVISMEDGPFVEEMLRQNLDVRIVGTPATPAIRGAGLERFRSLVDIAWYGQRHRAAASQSIRTDPPVQVVHVLWPQLLPIAAYMASQQGALLVWESPVDPNTRRSLNVNAAIYRRILGTVPSQVLGISDHTTACFRSLGIEAVSCTLSVDETRFDANRVTSHGSLQSLSGKSAAGKLVFGVFARVDSSKGQVDVLRGLARAASREKIHLLLLGSGPTPKATEDLRKLASDLELSDSVTIEEYSDRPETFYRLVDVAINSRRDPEPFGLSVVEAMLMSKPTLVHALGGPSETVVDGVTGWHVHSSEPTTWASALDRAVAQSPRWSQMGQEAQRRATELYTRPAQAERYCELVGSRLADIEYGVTGSR